MNIIKVIFTFVGKINKNAEQQPHDKEYNSFKKMIISVEDLKKNKPQVMGILNVTPDSFYDGGNYVSELAIIKRLQTMVKEGVDIVDVGAYSTRPGAAEVSVEEEIGRLLPAIEIIRKYYPRMPISVDTFRAKVGEEIVRCLGKVIINDISGGTMDTDMFSFVSSYGLPYVLMHIQGTPQTMQQHPHYDNVVEDIYTFFEERIHTLNAMGHKEIILDPGFGFGKTLAQNYELLNGMERFNALGYPLFVGFSRKSMIYKLFGTSPQEALNGTTALNTLALTKGASILRVHDVREAVEAVGIYTAMRALRD